MEDSSEELGRIRGTWLNTPSRSLLKVVKDLIKVVNSDQRQSSAGRALALDRADPGLIPSILSSIRMVSEHRSRSNPEHCWVLPA